MNEFYLPYHFVPVVKGERVGDLPLKDFDAGASVEVRHDRYAPGTKSGTITCTVEAVSPIFIGHEKRKDESGVVEGFKLDKRPALPASSLRGLIGSMAEAASNSA